MKWFCRLTVLSFAIWGVVGTHDLCAAGANPDVNVPADPGPDAALVDFNADLKIDLRDFSQFAWYWHSAEMSVDVAGSPGDGIADWRDLLALCRHWLEEVPAPIDITWLAHASVRIAWEDVVIYVDPRNLQIAPHDATLVLVSHNHGDHYVPNDIAKVSGPATQVIAAASVVQAYGRGQALAPGQTIELPQVRVVGVAAYNINKTNHPKANNWVGFIVELGGKRIYLAGDTDLTPEMKTLTNIDVAFLPAGGTYTMNAAEAAEATGYFQPRLAIPYHWGTSVGTLADAQRFAELAACKVKVMTAGETLSSRDWDKDFSFVAHWKLDEWQGDVARDSMGGRDGALAGGPLWQPSGGQIGGALQFDGVDDVVGTPFVLNPSEGPFSVFAWVRGGAPGQVILSQAGGESWLAADSAQGALETYLRQPKAGRSPAGPPLGSQAVIIGDEWHRLGLTWDGSARVLYVDNVEVARDTQTSLGGSTGGLNIGAGGTRAPGGFWSGRIDDVRLHNRVLQP